MRTKYTILLFCLWAVENIMAQSTVTKQWVRDNYTKNEYMIPMRDGKKLYTAVYTPRQSAEKMPMLLHRSPYGCAYGDNWASNLWNNWRNFAQAGYIFVFQDVRGKGKSEGIYVDIRPMLTQKHSKTDFDESTDTYDTADWLTKNIKGNNGNIGLLGSSYPGFYAMQGALSGHKAIKAAIPQAPVVDWLRGDDFHHNGAFCLRDAFSFFNRHCRPRPNEQAPEPAAKSYYSGDDYSFFLQQGCLKNITRLLNGEIPFWDDMMEHGEEDEWWKARDYRKNVYSVKPAIMVVGGLWDAEDYYGTCQLYRTIKEQSRSTPLWLVMGPWSHGAWNSTTRNELGNISFGETNQSIYYQDSLEFPFMHHYLKDQSSPLPSKVNMFFTGEYKWHKLQNLPEENGNNFTLYLNENGKLSSTAPKGLFSFSSYISNPKKPVPFMDGSLFSRPAEYMTADQRFASQRPDVLLFQTDILTEDITLCGNIEVNLDVILNTSDADFIVKFIDVYPDDYNKKAQIDNPEKKKNMNGYQLPVRMDILRGKYREGMNKSIPFTTNETTSVKIPLQAIAHTFRKGHRIALQIQSTCFPLFDLNPQTFTDIYHCSIQDFRPAIVQILHQKGNCSSIKVKRLP